jgi:hypothetical protein
MITFRNLELIVSGQPGALYVYPCDASIPCHELVYADRRRMGDTSTRLLKTWCVTGESKMCIWLQRCVSLAASICAQGRGLHPYLADLARRFVMGLFPHATKDQPWRLGLYVLGRRCCAYSKFLAQRDTNAPRCKGIGSLNVFFEHLG